jgi:hypothetical protein
MKILVELCTALAIHNDHMLTLNTESTPTQQNVSVTRYSECLLTYRVGKHCFHLISLPFSE